MKINKRTQSLFVNVVLMLVLALTTTNTNASPENVTVPDFTAIDRYITAQMNQLGIPGLGLGIIHGNQVVHLHGFGVADSSRRAVTPQTPFHIGSITKPFTAVAVMQLVEAGKIDLDAPVQKYIPWFEVTDKEQSPKVTVRSLLTHTSGISEKDGNRIWVSPFGLEATLRGLGALPLTNPVGTTWQYSNINFSLAGLIVEKVSGQSYADYITQHIFQPLDMHHTFTSHASALADGLSAGHYYLLGYPFEGNGPLPPSYLPSGLVISTAEDLSHFAIAELNDGQYNGTSILSPRGMAETHTPGLAMMRGDYRGAMDWAVGTVDGIPVLRHDGDTGYFHGIIFLQPDQKWGVILLGNASGFVEITQVDDIAKNVVEMLNRRAPASVSPTFGMRLLYWAILLMPFLLVVGIVYGWRNRKRTKGWHVLVTVLLYLVIAYLVMQIPIPFPIPSMLVFYPEVAYGLLGTVTVGIGWSVIYTVIFLMRRKSWQLNLRLNGAERVHGFRGF